MGFTKRVNVMVLETEHYRFEKGASEDVGTVNVFSLEGGEEIDCFTDYTIMNNLDKMEESCSEWLENFSIFE
jgi:hypothetical protein